MGSYPTIVPYLAIADAAAAIDFYKQAFGAEEWMRLPGPDRAVMHAEILVNGGLVMLTDAAPQVGFPAPAPADKVPVGIIVAWPMPGDIDAVYARAVAAGAASDTEPRDEAWGARFAAVTDPYGQRWWLHAPLTQG